MLKELATELNVTEENLRKFFLSGIPNIEIAAQETYIAKLIDGRDAEAAARNAEIASAQAKLEEMQANIKKITG